MTAVRIESGTGTAPSVAFWGYANTLVMHRLSGKAMLDSMRVILTAYVSSEDEEEEKRLRYVHFTRARKRLYIRYQGAPPKLLAKYYADFLS